MMNDGILAYMKRKVEATGYLEDFDGELHEGKLARVPIPNTYNAHAGSTFAYMRKGTTDHLIVMFMGGGLSWNEETAKYAQNPETIMNAKEPALYSYEVNAMTEFTVFGFSKAPGILTLSEENPFADWNVLVINYVTGDFHVGDHDFSYIDKDGNPKILHHKGHVNFVETMKAAKTYFPTADKLLITGGSAGAFAVPALAPEVMDAYPECKDVTVYSDSALILLDGFREAAEHVWNAPKPLVEAIHSNNLAADWYERLYAQKGDSIRYLYSNSYQDYLFATFQNYIDTGNFAATRDLCRQFTGRLTQHVDRLRTACPPMGFFINDFKAAQPGAKGTEHGMTTNATFLKRMRRESSGAQWLSDAVNGNVYDVGMSLLK